MRKNTASQIAQRKKRLLLTLRASALLALVFVAWGAQPSPAYAQWAVVDAGNIYQDTISAVENTITAAESTISAGIAVEMQYYDEFIKEPLDNGIRLLQHKLTTMQNDAIGRAAAMNADQQTLKKVMSEIAKDMLPDNHRTCVTMSGLNAMEVANRVSRVASAQIEQASVRMAMTTNPTTLLQSRVTRDTAYSSADPQWDNTSPKAVFNPNMYYNLPHTVSVVNGFYTMPSSPSGLSADETYYVAAYTFCERLLPIGPPQPRQTLSPADLLKFHVAQERVALQSTAYHDCLDAVRMRTAISQTTAGLSAGLNQWYQSQVRECTALANKSLISGKPATSGGTPVAGSQLANCITNGMSQLQINAMWHGYGFSHNMVAAGTGSPPSATNQPETGASDMAGKGVSGEKIMNAADDALKGALDFEDKQAQVERELNREFADMLAKNREDEKTVSQ